MPDDEPELMVSIPSDDGGAPTTRPRQWVESLGALLTDGIGAGFDCTTGTAETAKQIVYDFVAGVSAEFAYAPTGEIRLNKKIHKQWGKLYAELRKVGWETLYTANQNPDVALKVVAGMRGDEGGAHSRIVTASLQACIEALQNEELEVAADPLADALTKSSSDLTKRIEVFGAERVRSVISDVIGAAALPLKIQSVYQKIMQQAYTAWASAFAMRKLDVAELVGLVGDAIFDALPQDLIRVVRETNREFADTNSFPAVLGDVFSKPIGAAGLVGGQALEFLVSARAQYTVKARQRHYAYKENKIEYKL